MILAGSFLASLQHYRANRAVTQSCGSLAMITNFETLGFDSLYF